MIIVFVGYGTFSNVQNQFNFPMSPEEIRCNTSSFIIIIIIISASSQPRIISTGRNVIVGKKSISASVVIGKNLKTSGGRKVKIICAVSGWPIPKVVWQKNGKPVDHPTKKLQIGAARYRGSMLVIESASVTDSGIYTCYAINPAGVAMESSRVKILSKLFPILVFSLQK